MSKITEKELKQYFKEIKLLLPIYSSAERNFLKSLRVSVEEYIDQNPECTIEDIYENFDEPEEAVYNYISALDQTDLCKRVNLRRIIRNVLIIALIAVVAVSVIEAVHLHLLFKEVKSHIVTEIVTVIEKNMLSFHKKLRICRKSLSVSAELFLFDQILCLASQCPGKPYNHSSLCFRYVVLPLFIKLYHANADTRCLRELPLSEPPGLPYKLQSGFLG